MDCKNPFHSAYGNNGSEQAKRTCQRGLKSEKSAILWKLHFLSQRHCISEISTWRGPEGALGVTKNFQKC